MGTKKEQSGFERCLENAIRQAEKSLAILKAAQAQYRAKDFDAAYASTFDAANHSENQALLCRELPAYTGHPRAREMMEDSMLNSFPVEIGFTKEDWFCIRIPSLLPKKSKGSPGFISDPLYPAMNRFWRGKQPVRYPDNVIIFRHVYASNRPERLYRDHDNIELNKIVDIIGLYVMTDDAPMRCRHFYCSASGSSNRTEVYVVPRSDFIRWLNQECFFPKEGVTLYEDRSKGPKKRV